MYVVFVGPDRELGSALERQGADLRRVNGPATAAVLAEADVERADLLVVTDVAEATVVPVAREANPSLRIVVFSPDTLPEFVRGQVDLAISPEVLDPTAVAEELLG